MKTEWDDLDVESLTRVIATMKAASEKLEKESFDAKLKCEAIRGKSKEAQTEADELAKQIESVKAEILEMQHHHELEKCDYDSKLAHLEYINANMPNGVLDEQNQREIERMNLENEGNHVAIWNNVVQSGNDESLRLQKEHTEEISALQKQHQEEYDKLQQQLEDELVELKQRCKEREDAVQEELKLRYMIEIREQEERDSEYIQSIRQKHQNAVSEMKSFYSKLEHENVREIDSLQEENRKLQQDTDDLFQNAQNIEKENACLVEPLSKAELEVGLRYLVSTLPV